MDNIDFQSCFSVIYREEMTFKKNGAFEANRVRLGGPSKVLSWIILEWHRKLNKTSQSPDLITDLRQ